MAQQGSNVVLAGVNFGPTTQHVTCPSCQTQVNTKIIAETSRKTHIIALLLCLFGCWPCVCIPYCVDSCKNQNHYCPKCDAYLGTYVS